MAFYRLQGESGGVVVDLPLAGEILRLRRAESGGLEPDPEALGLPDSGVSTPHAELRLDGDGWRVVDLDSEGGTWIGATRVAAGQSAPVPPGATIRLGQFSALRIVAEEPAAAEGPRDPQAPVFALPDTVVGAALAHPILPATSPGPPPRPAQPPAFDRGLAVTMIAVAIVAVGIAAYWVWTVMR